MGIFFPSGTTKWFQRKFVSNNVQHNLHNEFYSYNIK